MMFWELSVLNVRLLKQLALPQTLEQYPGGKREVLDAAP
jgi:hypothetical protein